MKKRRPAGHADAVKRAAAKKLADEAVAFTNTKKKGNTQGTP